MANPPDAKSRIKRIKHGPTDTLDLLGVRAWSRALDVSPETALAAVTSILTGIAGPGACLETTWGNTPLPKLDLLTCRTEGSIQRVIDSLAAPVLQLNRRLSQKMGVHSPDMLDLCITGTSGGKNTSTALVEKAMLQHWQALTMTSGDESLLDLDLAFDPVPNRLEAIQNPEFVVENPRARDLLTLVDECHLHTALVIRPVLALNRKGPEPHQVISQLSALLNGTIVRKRGRKSSQPAKACAILALSENEIEFVQTSGPELMASLLWLMRGSVEDTPVDPEASRRFFRTYQQALQLILDARRQGRAPSFLWQSDQTPCEFESEFAKYTNELSLMQVNPGSSAYGLPQSLLWAMGFLRLAMPDGVPDDERLVGTAFSCARRLVKRHMGELTKKDDDHKAKARRVFAERIVFRIGRKACKLRDVARTFSVQAKANFMPMLNFMVELGVLTRDDQKVYQLGNVELSEVIDELLSKLEVAEAAGDQAASP